MPEAPNSQPTEAAAPVLGTTPSHMRQPKPDKGTEPVKPSATEPDSAGEPPKTEPKTEPEKPEPDYKVKFSESSKEANRLLEMIQKHGIDPKTGERLEPQPTEPKTEPAQPATPAPQPKIEPVQLTEQELAKAIPGFENLPAEEKEMIRDIKGTVKTVQELKKIVGELYDKENFAKEMSELTSKDDFKEIAGNVEEFKKFAYEEKNLNTPLEVLAKAFLYEKTKKPNQPAPVTGVEPGGSGGRQGGAPVQDDGMTADESVALRKSDPQKWNRLAAAGKIKIKDA